jgi:hypothetical protein
MQQVAKIRIQTPNAEPIQFDEDGNAILTEDDMIRLFRQTGWLSFITSADEIPTQCYILINKKLSEAHLIPVAELAEWEADGSCEPGDNLFKIHLEKRY